jgi:hypothetical protein
MAATKTRDREDEIRALERALAAVETAMERLRLAASTLDEQLQESAERTAMPNSRRADQQLRTALNATIGARRSLQRRLELRRGRLESDKGARRSRE